MYSFFVLGIVPGTNIQITFRSWINSVLLVIAVLLSIRLVRLVANQRHTNPQASRFPLHASQLHIRGF